MRRIAASSLIGDVAGYLVRKQAEIDALPDYADRVEIAKRLWNNKDREIFGVIRALLEELCPGIRRCHYCEDSAADEVEHVWPKSLYPEKTFRWTNYLFACGICNGSHKGDQFAVFDVAGAVFEQARVRNAPVLPPHSGESVFLDPHLVHPLDYLEFDPQTGEFVEIGEEPEPGFRRAEYTIKVLGLNRDYLVKQRRVAYKIRLRLAHEYVSRKSGDAKQSDLQESIHDMKQLSFPSVWEAIKRNASDHPAIFDFAPELLQI